MYSLYDRVLLLIPAVLALALALLTAVPANLFGITLTLNIAWLMTIIMTALYPPAWGYTIVFLLGLVQDVLFNTPLGAQATIGLLLLLALRARPQRISTPLFRMVWMEAVVMLIATHAVLWLILAWIGPAAPPPLPLLLGAVVNALWFPLLYWPMLAVTRALPQR